MTKEELIRRLSELYSLRDSGQKVETLIKELEQRLFVVLYTEPEVQPQYCPP